jgi:hypothetical protein
MDLAEAPLKKGLDLILLSLFYSKRIIETIKKIKDYFILFYYFIFTAIKLNPIITPLGFWLLLLGLYNFLILEGVYQNIQPFRGAINPYRMSQK